MPISYPYPIVVMIVVFTGLLGAVVGSFLNVCIHRLPRTYLSIAWPGSHCPQCGTFLHWYDNIPILSWLSLGGACRYCRGRIPVRYMLVEMLTAGLFIFYAWYTVIEPRPCFILSSSEMLIAEWQRWVIMAVALYLVGTMIVVTVIDYKYRIIPDQITYSGIFLAPLISALCPVLHPEIPAISNPHLSGLIASLFGVFVGGGSLYLIGVIGKLIFGKEAMGLGDVKFMAMVGGLLGWDDALLIFLLACLGGSVIGLVIFSITRDRYLPFGPYLALATLVTFLWRDEICNIIFVQWSSWVTSWLGLRGT